MVALYQNAGDMLFIDGAAPARIGRPTLPNLSFSTCFFDYDLGAVVEVVAGGATHRWLFRTGSGYLSQGQIAPIFGLAAEAKQESAAIVWRE